MLNNAVFDTLLEGIRAKQARMWPYGPIYIPENESGVREGYYEMNQLVQLLRDNCEKPRVIYFLADMMEV